MTEELEHGLENGFDEFGSERTGGSRVGVLKGAQGNGGGDFDGGVDIEVDESCVDVFHGGDEELGGVVGVDEDLVADRNGFDLSVGVVSDDVSLDPVGGEGLGLGDGGKELVRDVDGDLDVGSGESSEHGRVGVEDLDPLQALGLKKLRHPIRRRKIVGDSAVVHSYRSCICVR